MIKSVVISVTSAAPVLLCSTDAQGDAQAGTSVALAFTGTLYVGASNVTATTGFPAVSGMSIEMQNKETLYAIAATGTVSVNVLLAGA